jgi:hypothetical protein
MKRIVVHEEIQSVIVDQLSKMRNTPFNITRDEVKRQLGIDPIRVLQFVFSHSRPSIREEAIGTLHEFRVVSMFEDGLLEQIWDILEQKIDPDTADDLMRREISDLMSLGGRDLEKALQLSYDEWKPWVAVHILRSVSPSTLDLLLLAVT